MSDDQPAVTVVVDVSARDAPFREPCLLNIKSQT